ncbi:MAG: hypothetical protein K2L52_06380 [Clostridia bacterium]|nr:hypothetical protein [Clostridia bacterium]
MKKNYKWEEIIELMQGKELSYADSQVSEVIYSLDKAHRYVILNTDTGYLTYLFESLELYDEDELKYFPPSDDVPAYWLPRDNFAKPIFDDKKNLMRELKTQPEYKTFFEREKDEE